MGHIPSTRGQVSETFAFDVAGRDRERAEGAHVDPSNDGSIDKRQPSQIFDVSRRNAEPSHCKNLCVVSPVDLGTFNFSTHQASSAHFAEQCFCVFINSLQVHGHSSHSIQYHIVSKRNDDLCTRSQLSGQVDRGNPGCETPGHSTFAAPPDPSMFL